MSAWIWTVYIAPMLLIWIWYARRRARAEARSRGVLDSAREAGMIEPASLHPSIDPNRCVGCGACVGACPEQPEHHVLGLIDNKAHLVSPTDCIGHGACRAACPVGAITLVFGSATRGVDIPMLTPQFETNVPGIFIAGELGGMGLIRNALTQGRQAVEALAKRRARDPFTGVRVDVDEARRIETVGRVDHGAGRCAIEAAHGRDAISADPQVGPEPRIARPIHDAAVSDQNIKWFRLSLQSRARRRGCRQQDRGAREMSHGRSLNTSPGTAFAAGKPV